MVFTVAYDLHQPGRDYESVNQLLSSASGGHVHAQGSVWLIDSLNDAAWWRDKLGEAGDTNDEFLMARLQGNWGTKNDPKVAQWLKSQSRRW